jgi:glycosyltransferase involved in cell wall biosynthesis
MRIGVDARELQGKPTGVGRYLRSLLRAWPASGGDELLLYFRGHPVPLPPSPATLQSRTVGAATTRGLVWQERDLPAAARQDHLDVFFAPGYACPLRLDLPRVTAVHDVSFFNWPQDFALAEAMRRRWWVGRSLAASKRVLTISDFSRREIVALMPELAGRVVTTPLGSDDDLTPAPEREIARARLGLRGPLVLTVGSIFNRRRLPELLRAIARVAPRFPGLLLDVVGENRTHPRLDLQRLSRELGIHAHVRLSGFVDEAALAERYAAADVAVFLSEYEGFGLPPLEAAARGVPLIVSSRPALSEIFGSAALVADPLDVDGVAAALARLLTSPPLRAELAGRGHALAARHSWTVTASLTRATLDEARRA